MNGKDSIYYLDDNNNIVDKKDATHAIIRQVDGNGNLIGETYLVRKPEEPVKREPIDYMKELSQEQIDFINQFGKKDDSESSRSR
ncbi:MAG: hypothetical protein IK080_06980 [Clostridia bacterium]|nr:hypothetical protein [Clostridia bacterium]